MGKKVLIIVFSMLIAVCLFACSKTPEHEHTYSEAWTNDETHHWHAATCEHTEERSEYAEHSYDESGKCTVCGYEYVCKHTETIKVSSVEPTCTEAGLKEYYQCTECRRYFEDPTCTTERSFNYFVIKALGHDLEHISEKAVTDSEDGNKEYYVCRRCGLFYSDPEGKEEITDKSTVIEPSRTHKHDLVKHNGKKASCTRGGYMEYYECTKCFRLFSDESGNDRIYLSDIDIAAQGHEVSEYLHNDVYHTYTCLKCGEFVREAHSFTDGKCSICDFALSFTGGLNYELSDNAAYYKVVGSSGAKSAEVVLPVEYTDFTYETMPVKEIGASAFAYDDAAFKAGVTRIRSVTVPSGYERIDDRAFYGCEALEKISLPDTIKYIGANAFNKCGKLAFTEETIFSASGKKAAVAKYLGNADQPRLALITVNEVSGAEDWEYAISAETTVIANGAFADCSKLNKVELNAKYIGSYAFENCRSLSSVTLKGTLGVGADAFRGCIALQYNKVGSASYLGNDENGTAVLISGSGDVEVSDTTSVIASEAFSDLKSITFGASVKHIGKDAFYTFNGMKLDKVNYTGTVADWLDIEFETYYSNPLTIGHDLYINGELLTEVEAPSSVTAVKDFAFAGGSITRATLNSVTRIGDRAFYNCTFLAEVTFDGTKGIGAEAFSGCRALQSITVPSSVNVIGKKAFSGVTAEIAFASGAVIKELAAYAFSGYLGTEIAIPNGVKRIGIGAFENSPHIKQLTVPSSVNSIGAYAFSCCTELEAVNYGGTLEQWCGIEFEKEDSNPLLFGHKLLIGGNEVQALVVPDGIARIRDNAFVGCDLTSVKFGEYVSSIGKSAFFGCGQLKSVEFGGEITFVGEKAFGNCPMLQLNSFNGALYIGNSNSDDNAKYKILLSVEDTAIKSVSVSGAVEVIAENAFSDCTALGEVNYLGNADGWCNIKFSSYYSNPLVYAHRLNIGAEVRDMTVSASATEIGQYTFAGIYLDSITLGEGIRTVGKNAFLGSKINRVVYNGTVNDWAEIDFETINSNPLYSGHSLYLGTRPCENFELSVPTVKKYAFAGLKFASITVAATVVRFEEGAFADAVKADGEGVIYSGTVDDWLKIDFMSLDSNPLYTLGSFSLKEGDSASTSLTISADVGPFAFAGINIETLVLETGAVNFGADSFIRSKIGTLKYNGDINSWLEIDFANENSNPLVSDPSFSLVKTKDIYEEVKDENGKTKKEKVGEDHMLEIPSDVTVKKFAFVGLTVPKLVFGKNVKVELNGLYGFSAEEIFFRGGTTSERKTALKTIETRGNEKFVEALSGKIYYFSDSEPMKEQNEGDEENYVYYVLGDDGEKEYLDFWYEPKPKEPPEGEPTEDAWPTVWVYKPPKEKK